MKIESYKKAIILAFIVLCVGVGGVYTIGWTFREDLKDTFVADLYIKLFRGEKQFDDQHILTTLAGSQKKIIVNSEDKCVCRSIRIVGYWEKRNTQVLSKLVKPGQIILEVGANFGYYTLNFAHWLKGQGRIFAYEANPKVFKYLEKSIQLNQDQGIVQLMPWAASDKKFDAYLKYGLSNIGGGYVVTSESPEFEACKVSQTCLPIKSAIIDDDLKDIEHIDLLQIDAEGSEIPSLMGATHLIDRSPNLIIVMEWAPAALEKFGDVKDFLVFLKSKGFKFWSINQKDGSVLPINSEDLLNHPFLELILSRQDLNL